MSPSGRLEPMNGSMHGKFVLTEKGFLIEGLGLSLEANILIFKTFSKSFSEKADDCFYPLCSRS